MASESGAIFEAEVAQGAEVLKKLATSGLFCLDLFVCLFVCLFFCFVCLFFRFFFVLFLLLSSLLFSSLLFSSLLFSSLLFSSLTPPPSKNKDETCAVIKRAGNQNFIQSSQQFCDSVEVLDVNLFEGFEAHEGETVEEQFIRQLNEDLSEEKNSDLWLPQASHFISTLLQTYQRSSIPQVTNHKYHLRMQINLSDACIKFHDDFVGIRATVALCGDTTVVAPASKVNWEFWDATGGQLRQAKVATVHEFNEHVCKSEEEYAPQVGDILLMKGGGLCREEAMCS